MASGSPPERESPRDRASTRKAVRLSAGEGNSTIGKVCRFVHHADRACTFHASVVGFTDALVIEEFHFYARFYRALCYATIGRYRPALSDMSKCTKIVAKMDPADGGFGPGCDPPERLRFVCYFNLALLHLNVHEHRAAALAGCTCDERGQSHGQRDKSIVAKKVKSVHGNHTGCPRNPHTQAHLHRRVTKKLLYLVLIQNSPQYDSVFFAVN